MRKTSQLPRRSGVSAPVIAVPGEQTDRFSLSGTELTQSFSPSASGSGKTELPKTAPATPATVETVVSDTVEVSKVFGFAAAVREIVDSVLSTLSLGKGDKGDDGDKGDVGPGVPVGGTVGQFLEKTGPADYATAWADAPSGGTSTPGPPGQGVPTGGTAGQVLTKTGTADYADAWQDLPPATSAPSGDALRVLFGGNYAVQATDRVLLVTTSSGGPIA